MNETLEGALRRIMAKVRLGEWDMALLWDIALLVYLAGKLATEPQVFGLPDQTAGSLSLARELFADLAGEDMAIAGVAAGVGGSVILNLAIKVLLAKLMAKAVESGLPSEAAAWLIDKIQTALGL